jgi:hypothetical protein
MPAALLGWNRLAIASKVSLTVGIMILPCGIGSISART